MYVYGSLIAAQAEPLASDPAVAPDARIYYNTASDKLKYYRATAASWVTLVDAEKAAVLLLKDYDGGTATNTSRMTLPSAAIATLQALTRKAGTCVFATDTAEKRAYADNGAQLIPMSGPVVTGSTGAPTALVAGTALVPAAGAWDEVNFIKGSGGAVIVSANPQIAAGAKIGQRLTLIGGDDTNTVEYKNGTGMDLNGAIVLNTNVALSLIWDGTNWRETSRRG